MKVSKEFNLYVGMGTVCVVCLLVFSLIAFIQGYEMIVGVSTIIMGLVMFIGLWVTGLDVKTTQIENILKKNNLWEEDFIKKSELKK